jgi:hypothetical protein
MEKVITRSTLKAPSRDLAYWLSRPVEERIAAVEQLRQDWLDAHPEVSREFQRVVRVTRLHAED